MTRPVSVTIAHMATSHKVAVQVRPRGFIMKAELCID